MPKKDKPRTIRPAQTQSPPGEESKMRPKPRAQDPRHKGSGKLAGRVAVITGGDSGIGRAVAVAFAREGADLAVSYLSEHKDAQETQRLVKSHGRKCLLIPGDIGYESHCRKVVDQTVEEFGRLDILVNNAAEQHPRESIEEIDREQLERTFQTNIFSYFFMTRAAMKHLEKQKGGTIVNTTSVTAYRGSEQLLDYASTKAPSSPSHDPSPSTSPKRESA
jgi:NAD(P)-dependent dehydrogenase (short-subunit alcohol dehydrogenase family)